MNKWKVEVRTNKYDGLTSKKVIRTDFFYSEQKPAVLRPESSDGLIDILVGADRILVRASDVEFLHVAEIDSAAVAKQREDRISELVAEVTRLAQRERDLKKAMTDMVEAQARKSFNNPYGYGTYSTIPSRPGYQPKCYACKRTLPL